jgi:hypothetical protein
MLHEGKATSMDLVNYYGARCFTIGRELCMTTEELFDSAKEKAVKCDSER